MASAGTSGATHVAGELFKAMTGINMVHVPYRGDTLALIDLMGGQIQVMFDLMPASIQYIRTDKLRALVHEVCNLRATERFSQRHTNLPANRATTRSAPGCLSWVISVDFDISATCPVRS
jgi:tripartite-type tricarboxylate transporter receptor subunit TctC